MEQFKKILPPVIRNNFFFATWNFILIIAYVNIFQVLFGAENSIAGVIFTIMMSASMARDLTGSPVRHLLTQAFVLAGMTLSAFFVTILPPVPSFFINLFTLFLILYAFTYEYSSHLYFPYILSYLFLIFISPATAEQLPRRILGMLFGAVSIIVYQLCAGHKRAANTANEVLSTIMDYVCSSINAVVEHQGEAADPAVVRHKLCELSRTVYERRKKVLCVSEAGFSLIDVGRGLEQFTLLLHELKEPLSDSDQAFLRKLSDLIKQYRDFLNGKAASLPPLDHSYFNMEWEEPDKLKEVFYKNLVYIYDRLLHMTDPEKRTHYRRTATSFKIRLMAALDISPVRFIYAGRISLLLAAAALLVQLLQLPHGKWLLFTLASVSLPYADDIPAKAGRRITATLIGGLVSIAVYTLIPSAAGRTAVMMLSGYISFYFSRYTGTFACSTIGALGGAVFMSAFGFSQIGHVFIIRTGYIAAGILVSLLVNCLIFPFKRETATKQLWEKYQNLVELLTKVCKYESLDPQLYYNLVIQAHLQEDKISQNAALEGWEQMPAMLSECRRKVRKAHRFHIEGRDDAPIFSAVYAGGGSKN